MKKMIAISMVALALGACMTDDDGEMDDIEEAHLETAPTPTSLLLDVMTWVGGEGASFVAGEVFGLPMPTEAVDISQAALDEIRKLVAEEIQDALFVEYNAKADGVLRQFGEYNGVVCDAIDGEGTGDCSVDNLYSKRDSVVLPVSKDAQAVYDLYENWHTKSGGKVLTDRSWQVTVANNVMTMMAVDLAMRREAYEINRLLGLDTDKTSAWTTLKATALRYSNALDSFLSEYDRLSAEFGPVEIVEHSSNWQTGYDYQACFNAPGGPDCGGDDVKIHVKCGLEDSYCYEPDPDDPNDTEAQRIIDAANDRLTKRKQTFQEQAIGDPEDFRAMVEEVRKISTMPEPAGCEPVVSVETSGFSGNTEAQSECPGVCTEAGGTFTGQWWSPPGTGKSVCQCEFSCE